MKKILAVISILMISLWSFSQNTRPALINQINNDFYTNSQKKITGDMLNDILKKISNSSWITLTDGTPLVFPSTFTMTVAPTDTLIIKKTSNGLFYKIPASALGGGGGGSGTVTSATVTPSADIIGAVGTPSTIPTFSLVLTPTGVTSGTYGDATHGVVVTVDNKGRVTAISTTTITPGGVTSVSGTAPISILGTSTPTVVIANAAADGSGKGAASFDASDFNSSSGNISIDYINGQAASGSTKGFVTAADWFTFWSKQSALAFESPITLTGSTVGLGTVPIAKAGLNSTATPTASTILTGTGSAWVPTTATYPSTITNTQVLRGTGTNAIGSDGTFTYDGTSGQIGNSAVSGLSIGTALPTINTVNHGFVGGNFVLIGQNSAGGEAEFGLNYYYNSGFKYRFTDGGSGQTKAARMGWGMNGRPGDLDFETAPTSTGAGNAITWTTRMTLANSGNFGINNTVPSEKLDVGGNIRFSGALMPNNNAGTSGAFMRSGGSGTFPLWSTSTIPSSAGAIANRVLLSDGTNYVLSTPTFPNAAATTRKIIVSDGTNWIASTETYAVPGTSGNILKSDGTNWTSSAPTYSGTVTSIGISGGSTGLTFSGGPITGAGTFTVAGTAVTGIGGTGTSNTFMQGSNIFAGTSGIYTENNSQYFWDNTNYRLGIGTNSPSAKLDIAYIGSLTAANINAVGNYTTTPTVTGQTIKAEGAITPTGLQVTAKAINGGAANAIVGLVIDTNTTGYNNAGNFLAAKAKYNTAGTFAASGGTIATGITVSASGATNNNAILVPQGFVGIGLSNPEAPLHTIGTGTTSSSYTAIFKGNSGLESLRLFDSGLVGIGTGTTTPSAKLSVIGTGTTSTTNAITIANAAGTTFITAANDKVLLLNEAHLKSTQATAPTCTVTGTGITSAATTTGSSDIRGVITSIAPSPAPICTITLIFNRAYAIAPFVMISGANSSGGAQMAAGAFVSNITTTGFTIDLLGANNNPSFSYLVLE